MSPRQRANLRLLVEAAFLAGVALAGGAVASLAIWGHW